MCIVDRSDQIMDAVAQRILIRRQVMRSRKLATTVVLIGASLLFACAPNSNESYQSSSGQANPAPSKAEVIDSKVDASLVDLYRTAPGAQAMVEHAKGVLVFPSITKAGFIAGVEYGEGALRVKKRTTGYYSVTGGSFGLTAGVQETAQAILFNTQESLDKFMNSNGWTVGADASVAVIKLGAGGTVDTRTANSPVQAIVYNTSGLMADVSIAGQKIKRITP
jgi:lipid-binding SYLF domain-containing protein